MKNAISCYDIVMLDVDGLSGSAELFLMLYDTCGMTLSIFNAILWPLNAPEQRFLRKPVGSRKKMFVSSLYLMGPVFQQFEFF
jgi:hypothetical protein